jgi:DNA-binding SARP family transcriptional activator
MALAVLGRFELTRGGRTVALGASQEARLLKLVAVKGGEVHVEQAIEALWPEVKPGAGRGRLRTVLNRLRHAATDVVSRQGERLVLGADVRLDLAQFTSEARQAQALGGHDLSSALALARSAIARYRGPLLPHDPYEEWAEEPREAVRQVLQRRIAAHIIPAHASTASSHRHQVDVDARGFRQGPEVPGVGGKDVVAVGGKTNESGIYCILSPAAAQEYARLLA